MPGFKRFSALVEHRATRGANWDVVSAVAIQTQSFEQEATRVEPRDTAPLIDLVIVRCGLIAAASSSVGLGLSPVQTVWCLGHDAAAVARAYRAS